LEIKNKSIRLPLEIIGNGLESNGSPLDIETKPYDNSKKTDWNSIGNQNKSFDFHWKSIETDWTSNGIPLDVETKPDDNNKRTDWKSIEIKNKSVDSIGTDWKQIGNPMEVHWT
jgi:hypothetical protein